MFNLVAIAGLKAFIAIDKLNKLIKFWILLFNLIALVVVYAKGRDNDIVIGSIMAITKKSSEIFNIKDYGNAEDDMASSYWNKK